MGWLFALAIYVAKVWFLLGELAGIFTDSIRDYAYFSGVTHTAVGYGDIWPTGSYE